MKPLTCQRCGVKVGERSRDGAMIRLSSLSIFLNDFLSVRCNSCGKSFRLRPALIPAELENIVEVRKSLNLP